MVRFAGAVVLAALLGSSAALGESPKSKVALAPASTAKFVEPPQWSSWGWQERLAWAKQNARRACPHGSIARSAEPNVAERFLLGSFLTTPQRVFDHMVAECKGATATAASRR